MVTPDQIKAETQREMLTQLRIDVAVMRERTESVPELCRTLANRLTVVEKSLQDTETNVKWLKRGMLGGVPAIGVLITTAMGFLTGLGK
jgi:hypothetical protein